MSELWTTPVREYMSKALLSVRPEATLEEVQHLLDTRDISASPVVDEGGALCGIVSSSDLLRESVRVHSDEGVVSTPPLDGRTAADIMCRKVHTVGEEEPLHAAAAIMVAERIHRLVVLRQGEPVGVISTRDAMRAVLFHHVELPLAAIMSTSVLSVQIGEPIADAVERLLTANVHGLVVLDGHKPVGVFTHREAIRVRALPLALRRTPVEGVMSYEVLALPGSTPLYRVAGYAIQTRVRRICVTEGDALVGVVSGFDVLRVMADDVSGGLTQG